MYHYVRAPQKSLPNFRYLHIDNFKKQLDYFQSKYGFITKDEFDEYLSSGQSTEGTLLTFDDGLSDHYDFVFPELKKRGLWAIFFTCSAPLTEKNLLNVHRVHHLLGAHPPQKIYKTIESILEKKISNLLPKEIYTNQHSSWEEKAVKYLFNYHFNFRQSNELLAKIFSTLSIDEEELHNKLYMSPTQLKEMHDSGMYISAHAHSHRLLSKLNKDESLADIEQSVLSISSLIPPRDPVGFCYPYGGEKSYTLDQRNYLTALGVQYSFSVDSQDINCASDILALPRYDCNEFPFGNSTVG